MKNTGFSTKLDRTNIRYGSLVAVKPVGKSANRCIIWLCKCDCGKSVEVNGSQLGHTKSCGCSRIEPSRRKATTHGLSGTPEHRIWMGIRKRCLNPTDHAFERYGERGITICERWDSFENFLADMGKRPTPQHSVERKDNNGNYEPDNCKWALPIEQGNNQRSNHLITFRDKTQTIAEWSRELNVSYRTLEHRINRHWPIEEALTHPYGQKRRKSHQLG